MLTTTSPQFVRSAAHLGGFIVTTCVVCQQPVTAALDPHVLEVGERVHVCQVASSRARENSPTCA
jgi:hypothetical protein